MDITGVVSRSNPLGFRVRDTDSNPSPVLSLRTLSRGPWVCQMGRNGTAVSHAGAGQAGRQASRCPAAPRTYALLLLLGLQSREGGPMSEQDRRENQLVPFVNDLLLPQTSVVSRLHARCPSRK